MDPVPPAESFQPAVKIKPILAVILLHTPFAATAGRQIFR